MCRLFILYPANGIQILIGGDTSIDIWDFLINQGLISTIAHVGQQYLKHFDNIGHRRPRRSNKAAVGQAAVRPEFVSMLRCRHDSKQPTPSEKQQRVISKPISMIVHKTTVKQECSVAGCSDKIIPTILERRIIYLTLYHSLSLKLRSASASLLSDPMSNHCMPAAGV